MIRDGSSKGGGAILLRWEITFSKRWDGKSHFQNGRVHHGLWNAERDIHMIHAKRDEGG